MLDKIALTGKIRIFRTIPLIIIYVVCFSVYYENKTDIYTQINDETKYFEVNESNQTYGTYLTDKNGETIEPELISVQGMNNVEGYVKKIELYDEENQPKNPSEAIEYIKSGKNKEERLINIYNSDGKTVIGKYNVGGSNE